VQVTFLVNFAVFKRHLLHQVMLMNLAESSSLLGLTVVHAQINCSMFHFHASLKPRAGSLLYFQAAVAAEMDANTTLFFKLLPCIY
jgi:hypothetical protein